jgi:hypothetical protein
MEKGMEVPCDDGVETWQADVRKACQRVYIAGGQDQTAARATPAPALSLCRESGQCDSPALAR